MFFICVVPIISKTLHFGFLFRKGSRSALCGSGKVKSALKRIFFSALKRGRFTLFFSINIYGLTMAYVWLCYGFAMALIRTRHLLLFNPCSIVHYKICIVIFFGKSV